MGTITRSFANLITASGPSAVADGSITTADITGNINFKNLVINGDMSIAQRGTSHAGITDNNYHTIDRWKQFITTSGTFTMSQSTDVPTGQGFAKSLKYVCTTASASLASGANFHTNHSIEAQNCQYLKFGTANAQVLTLSFWVKSNKIGTYIAQIYLANTTKTISQAYTINNLNTWEKKIISYIANTTDVINNDNSTGINIWHWLVAGTGFSSGTLNSTWLSRTSSNDAVGQVNLADTVNNEWYITGVQLEAGTTASDFEFLPVDVNLARCRRYFESNFHIGTAPANGVSYLLNDSYSDLTAYTSTVARISIPFKVTKRANPTITFFNVTGLGAGTTAGKWQLYEGGWTESTGSVVANEIRNGNFQIDVTDSYTIGQSHLVDGGFTANSEL